MTKDEFVLKAKQTHGNTYDYSLVEEKLNSRRKITILCKNHGEFTQYYHNHLYGNKCKKCANEIIKDLSIQQAFINQAIRIHNDKYDYSLVDYINRHTKVKILCKIHNTIFNQRPANHLRGEGCNLCSKNKKMSNFSFIEKCKTIHNDKYDYSLIDYRGAHYKVKISCPKHGIFYQKASHHIKGIGCPTCRESRGERKIRKFLENHHIDYIPQYKIPKCKNIKSLPFDFYILSKNILIEFQGPQHYMLIDFSGYSSYEINLKNFNYTQQNDQIKRDYCKNNNISLIEISYKDNVEEKLKAIFNL